MADMAKKWGALIVAAVVLIIYVVLAFIAWDRTDTASEQTWNRGLVILAGIEAIAFAGVGWLFGKEVSREAIDGAQKAATDAATRADTEQEKARVAQADAVALAAKVEGAAGGQEAVAAGGSPQQLAGEILAKYRTGKG